MFLKSYVELAVDFERVRASLQLQPERWLHGLPVEMEREGARLLSAAGVEVGGRRVHGPFWMEVGDPLATARVLSIPFRLPGHEGLFEAMEGSLDAAWLGAGRTHLALAAQYQAPSTATDANLHHRVAEAAAKRFLEGLAGRLAAEASATGPSTRYAGLHG